MRFSLVAASAALAVSQVTLHELPESQRGSASEKGVKCEMPPSIDPKNATSTVVSASAHGAPAKPAGSGFGKLPAPVPGYMFGGKCMCPPPPPPPACPASVHAPVPAQPHAPAPVQPHSPAPVQPHAPAPVQPLVSAPKALTPSPSGNVYHPSSSSQGSSPPSTLGPSGSHLAPTVADNYGFNSSAGVHSANSTPAHNGGANNSTNTTSAAGIIVEGSSFTSVMALVIAVVLY